MAARKKKTKEVQVTKVDPNKGTTLMYRRSTKEPEKIQVSIRDFEKIYVHHLYSQGKSKPEIAAKLSLTTAQVTHILKTPVKELHVTGLELDLAFRSLSAKKLILANECLDAITQEDIDNASFMQKATGAAMLTDKAVQMDKHIRGTNDTTGVPVTAQTRDDLDREIRKMEEKLGIIKDVEFEVLGEDGGSLGSDGNSSRGERVPDGQFDLFTRNLDNPEEGGPTKQLPPKQPGGREISPGVILRKNTGGNHAR